MLSIPDTLSHHRATRDQYMHAVRLARKDCDLSPRLRQFARGILKLDGLQFIDPEGALRCFLRHARAANRKLVAVKRLQRMLSSPNNWDGWI
jgi:hypothetical protein